MWYGDCKIRNYISPPPCPVSSPLPSQMQPETEEAMLTHISQLILVACFMISVLRFCTCTKTKTENTHPWAMAYGSIQTPNPSPSPGCGCIAEDQWWLVLVLVLVRPRHLRKCKHCPSILACWPRRAQPSQHCRTSSQGGEQKEHQAEGPGFLNVSIAADKNWVSLHLVF